MSGGPLSVPVGSLWAVEARLGECEGRLRDAERAAQAARNLMRGELIEVRAELGRLAVRVGPAEEQVVRALMRRIELRLELER